jgi:phage/plasmid primase-like uncharacterized protein
MRRASVAGLFLQENIMNIKRNIDAAVVREAARGRWVEILTALAPELDKALSKPGRHVGCPVHGGKDGFRLFGDVDRSGGGVCNSCGPYPDGFALVRWLKDIDFPTALSVVNDVVLAGAGPSAQIPVRTRKTVQLPPDPETVKLRLNEAWGKACLPLSPKSELLWGYLGNRGLSIPMKGAVKSIRLHPGLQSFDGDGQYEGTYPCILALVQDRDGHPVTLHRTYITTDGTKAPVESPKKMMRIPSDRRVQGGACRLARGGSAIGIAEGIETALAVWQATGMPVWAALNAQLLKLFDAPPGVRTVWIWGDRDASRAGQKAAAQLKERLDSTGIENGMWIPGSNALPDSDGRKSIDWLDVLIGLGPHAFPLAATRVPHEYRQAA